MLFNLSISTFLFLIFFLKTLSSVLEKLYTIVDENDNAKENFTKNIFSVAAINALLNYFTETQKVKLEHINKIKVYEVQKFMSLDVNARRSLELVERMADKSKKGTLIWVLDKTSTSMGGRLLRRWINDPLLCPSLCLHYAVSPGMT